MKLQYLLPLVLLAGCQSANKEQYFIRSTADFIAANEEVLRLTKGPFTKMDVRTPFVEKDVNDLREAQRILKGMIQYRPDSFSLHMQSGTIHLALNENEEAADRFLEFQNYIPKDLDPTLEPLVSQGFFYFADALFRVKRYEDAELAVNRSLQNTPNESRFLTMRASIRIELQKLKDAEADLEKALKSTPNYRPAKDLLKFLRSNPPA